MSERLDGELAEAAARSRDGDRVKKLMDRIQAFREDRDWNRYHTPRNLAVSVAIEAGELCEHFQWDNEDDIGKHVDDNLSLIGEEIADVMIYCLNLCQVLGLDPMAVMNHKMGVNELRFLPPGKERPRGGA